MKKIGIIDYGVGNLESVSSAITKNNSKYIITNDPSEIDNCDKLILPGVGSFEKAMSNVNRLKIDKIIKDAIIKQKNILGICLGMQILLTKSFEFGEHGGLDLIKGEVKNLKTFNKRIKTPHIGWNNILLNKIEKKNSIINLFDGINHEEKFYFVHSYYCINQDNKTFIANTKYQDLTFSSVFKKETITACQFHPEKSGVTGLRFFKNWINA